MRIYILITLAILSACRTGYTPQKQLNCVEPPKPCIVPKWQGEPLDTNSKVKAGEYYFRISNVGAINTSKNEYMISHIDNDYGILTSGGDNYQSQKLNKVIKVESDLINPLEQLNEGEVPLGFASSKNNTIYYASIPNFLTNENLDKHKSKEVNKFKYIRIPISEMAGRSRIYRATINEFKIENQKESNLSEGLSAYDWESHPAISPDGKILFFASTRDGGFGGIDIWFAKINSDGSFGDPINLGASVNTPMDEVSPFITNDGNKLYFSSNGRESVGGFDIHYSVIRDEFWSSNDLASISNAENVGFPLNTEFNELFPTTDKSINERIYYSSDQNGGEGNFDIWVYHKKQRNELITKNRKDKDFDGSNFDPDVNLDNKVDNNIAVNQLNQLDTLTSDNKVDTLSNRALNIANSNKIQDGNNFSKNVNKQENENFKISGIVTSEDNKPIKNANVSVKELPEEKIQSSTKTNEFGEYNLIAKKGKDLKITANGENYFFDEFIIPENIQDTLTNFKRNLKLDLEITLRINFPYDVYDNPYEFVLDENGKQTKQRWQNELDEIAKNIIRSKDNLKKVILIGHTDLIGSEIYNNELGLNRVLFVSNKLIKEGVPEELLEVRSAGKSEPLKRKENETQDLYYKRLRRVTLEKIFKE